MLRKWTVLSDPEFFLSILKGVVRNIRDVNEHSKFAGHPVPMQISTATTIIAAPPLAVFLFAGTSVDLGPPASGAKPLADPGESQRSHSPLPPLTKTIKRQSI